MTGVQTCALPILSILQNQPSVKDFFDCFTALFDIIDEEVRAYAGVGGDAGGTRRGVPLDHAERLLDPPQVAAGADHLLGHLHKLISVLQMGFHMIHYLHLRWCFYQHI